MGPPVCKAGPLGQSETGRAKLGSGGWGRRGSVPRHGQQQETPDLPALAGPVDGPAGAGNDSGS